MCCETTLRNLTDSFKKYVFSASHVPVTVWSHRFTAATKTWRRIKSSQRAPGYHMREANALHSWSSHSLSWGGYKGLVLCISGSPVSLWLVMVPVGLSTCHSRMKGLEAQNQWFFCLNWLSLFLKCHWISNFVSPEIPLLWPSYYCKSKSNLTRPPTLSHFIFWVSGGNPIPTFPKSRFSSPRRQGLISE